MHAMKNNINPKKKGDGSNYPQETGKKTEKKIVEKKFNVRF
jgi:hypothetical protein